MLARNQKDSIIAAKNRPGLKEFIYGAKINPLLFTSIMNDIRNKFGLGEISYLRLVAYDDNILQSSYTSAVFKLESMKSVKSKPALFMSVLNEISKANQFRPDWAFFYHLCEILDISIPSHKDDTQKKSHGPKTLSTSELEKIKLEHDNKKKAREKQELIEFQRSLPLRINELQHCIQVVNERGCPIGKQFTLPLMNSILKDLKDQYSKISDRDMLYVDEDELFSNIH